MQYGAGASIVGKPVNLSEVQVVGRGRRTYTVAFKFGGVPTDYPFLGISPEGIGTVGMFINMVVAGAAADH